MRGIFETSLQRATLKDILNASVLISYFISFFQKNHESVVYGSDDTFISVKFNDLLFVTPLQDHFIESEIVMLKRILSDGLDISFKELFGVDLGRVYTVIVTFKDEDIYTYIAKIDFSYKGMEKIDAADVEFERDTARFHALCAEEES